MCMPKWFGLTSVWVENYDLVEDISDGEWKYLFEDLKEDYAHIKGWDEDEHGFIVYWDEDDDKLHKAEEAAYQVIAEIRELKGWS